MGVNHLFKWTASENDKQFKNYSGLSSSIKNIPHNFGFTGVAHSSDGLPFLSGSDGNIYKWISETNVPEIASNNPHIGMISCINIVRLG